MEKNIKKTEATVKETSNDKKVSKTWLAIQKYKGTTIVNDPQYLL